ncbi:MAG: hypothetical protein JWL84_6105 [Rhodospirillales bacterium]|jgi:hypothetical protein|nr:hypothetical protein [Rhodospirillales bacterium]
MSAVGSILGYAAQSYVPSQVATPAGQSVQDATNAAAQTIGTATATAQTLAAGAKSAVAGTSGIAPLANNVLAQLIADQTGQTQSAAPADPGLATVADGSDPAKVFLNYMKETPAQRIEDSWLASHHLTRKQLDAMPPAARQAIEKQMQAEIKEQIARTTDNKMKAKTLALA